MSFLTSLSILRSFFLNHYAENSPQSTFDRVLHENPGAAVFMSQIRFLPMRWESVNSLYSTPGLRPCRKEGRWWRAEVLSSRAEDTQERKEMVTWRSTELQGWGHPGRKGDGDVEKRWAPGLRTPMKEGRWWHGEALSSRAEDTQEGREMVTAGQVHCRRPSGVLPTALALLTDFECSRAIGLGALYSFLQEVFHDLRVPPCKASHLGYFGIYQLC